MLSGALASSPATANGPTVFIDRNSGGRAFRGLLPAGLVVVLHDEIFPDNKTKDHDWLKALDGKGYIVVTGDKDTTRTPLFLRRLKQSRQYVFVLYGLNGATFQGKADCIKAAYPKMIELMASRQAPALWKIAENNVTAHLCDHDKILWQATKSHRI